MSDQSVTLTFALMGPPYETALVGTALRLLEAALRKGYHVNVVAYEGAVSLGFAAQQPHANGIKGTSAEEEGHPTTKDWVAGLAEMGEDRLDWVKCGLCVDERGMSDLVAGRRGGPPDFHAFIENSTNTLTIGTR